MQQMTTAPTTTFAIFVYDDVEPIDIGATYGVLSIARRIIPQIKMFTVACQSGEVRLTNELVMRAQYGFSDCPPFDILIVTGGPGWQQQCRDPETLAFLRRAAVRTDIASVCTGGMILAAAGLLDGRAATTRRHGVDGEITPLQRLEREYGDVQALEALVVDSGDVVTGGGVSLGIDTMLYLLGRLYGAAKAADVARLLEYDRARAANMAALAVHQAVPAQ
jgi:transcriptional regulator GlxA family with amidase domain